jgi:hypothetical protein
LEYPTETWAAQELRKANVLRLAARFADVPLDERLRERGAELADRAWNDLLSFSTFHYARPVAIALVEGAKDVFFHGADEPAAPKPMAEARSLPKEPILSQRSRVRRRAASVRGALALGGGLLRRAWKRLCGGAAHHEADADSYPADGPPSSG